MTIGRSGVAGDSAGLLREPTDVVVSPDGTLAAYRSSESGQDEIYIRSFPEPGERTIVSQGGGSEPFWSPDGDLNLGRVGGFGGP